MTTSGTITSAMSAAQMIAKAMKDIGALSSGEQPTGSEMIDGIEALNWMLKSLAADGANLFAESTATATFGANVATVTLSPRVNDVIEARVAQSSTFDRVLARWETGQYRVIPNKTASGNPTAYTLAPTVSGMAMTIWPVPTTSTTVKYSYSRIIEDVTAGEQTIDLPQMWTETVYLNLASRLANMFGATRTDPAAVARIDKAAAAMLGKMLDYDRPASIFMGSARRRASDGYC